MMLLLRKLRRCVLAHVCQYANHYATSSNTYMFSRVVLMIFSDVGTYEFWLRYMFYDPLVVSFYFSAHYPEPSPRLLTATVSEQVVKNVSRSGYTCSSTHCCPLSRAFTIFFSVYTRSLGH